MKTLMASKTTGDAIRLRGNEGETKHMSKDIRSKEWANNT